MCRFKTVILSIFVCSIMVSGVYADEDADELVGHMTSLQYFSHKLALSIDHKNQKLAEFYLHEIEENLEAVQKIESYDGHPIGSLIKDLLAPAVEGVEAPMKAGRWGAASEAFDRMVTACNTCHATTDHAYIKIVRSAANPFMQSFTP